ncbi:MAG: response regulator [Chromatiales bacterium]|nr:response regulator [Chromatiales bacterium]
MPIPEEFRFYTRRVLIVDDEKAMANAIRRTLRSAGLETQIALDGFQAGTKLMSFMPAVMTLDLQMPGLDGFELLEFVRSEAAISKVKVLVISALPESDLQRALEVGANDVLEKPFSNETLVEKVAVLLGEQVGVIREVNDPG